MPITNVVFDLGRVLVDFSMDPVVQFLNAHGAELADSKQFVTRSRLADYEHGFISNDEFLDGLAALCTIRPQRQVLIERWVRIFSAIPVMTDYAQTLRPAYRVFILSNTSDLHWRYLCEEFRLKELADGCLTSFEVGAMKPNPKIFQEAVRRFSIAPEASIFIDDLAANVEGARACGWHGLVHRTPAETAGALAALGIRPSR